MALHRSFYKLQGRPAIPAFCGENFEPFTFVIDSASEVRRRPVDPDEYLVQVPSPLRI